MNRWWKTAARTVGNDKGSTRIRLPRADRPSIGDLLSLRMSRRDFSRAALSVALVPAAVAACARDGAEPELAATTGFREVPFSADAEDVLPPGYSRQLLIGWGDPLTGGAPPFDARNQTADAASRQFGYNNDFLAWLPFDRDNPNVSDHGLLVVNHEYPLPWLMWHDLDEETAAAKMDREQVDASMAAIGLSVVEVKLEDGRWQVVAGSRYNRRVSMFTPIEIRGPARGHRRMRTGEDPEGVMVVGTHDNCNGGVTPWGTVLSCEEGSSDFFSGDYEKSPDREHLERYYYDAQSDTGDYGWGRFHARLDFEQEMNEPNRFEWVVEIDPYDPERPPVKRTALGRFAHEGAHTVLNADGRVVVFMGDDWEFEYIYRYVSDGRYNAGDRAANFGLLDEGTLSVARFDEDGSLEWLPLCFGEGPITPENGFTDPGDVMVQTRRAADLLGATPMDAPEGFVSNPETGALFLALTQNRERTEAQRSPANPRAGNEYGHMLELAAPRSDGGPPDFAAPRFAWSVLVLCGDEEDDLFHPETTADGRFTDPDNLTVDAAGHLWVCTDAGNGVRDALYVMETEGSGRALSKRFYLPALESECCSPVFTPDGRNLFLSVQHPGEEAKNIAESVTRWPSGEAGEPPRPSVIVITKDDGGIIGSQEFRRPA